MFLDGYDGNSPQSYGPKFHRWLPDGEEDAIALPTDDAGWCVRVWFKREGKMEGAFIKYARGETAFDSSTIEKQGSLNGGPLRGQLDADLDDEDITAIQAPSEHGERVARRIIQAIDTPVSSFVEILRTNYGQYWLTPWPSWDSRIHSVQAALSFRGVRLVSENEQLTESS